MIKRVISYEFAMANLSTKSSQRHFGDYQLRKNPDMPNKVNKFYAQDKRSVKLGKPEPQSEMVK